MNFKNLSITVVFVFTVICSLSQNYIRFNESFQINGQHILKGEIYELIAEKKIIFLNDTIDIGNAKTEVASLIGISQILKKSDLVMNFNDTNYQINVTKYINGKDSIKFVTSDNNVRIFVNKGIDYVKIQECGPIFRLIIPNLPSVIFYEGEIPKNVIKKAGAEIIDIQSKDEGLFSKISWWQYLIAFLIFILVVFLFYHFFYEHSKKSKREFIKKIYTGGKLSDFARNNKIELDDLIKFNEKLLKGYTKLDNSAKEKFQKKIKNNLLIIGYSETEELQKDENFNQPVENEKTNVADIQDIQSPIQNLKELSDQIQQMERKILNKIDLLNSNKEASQKIETQQKENEALRGKNIELNKDIERSNAEIDSLRGQNILLNKEIEKTIQEKEVLYNELIQTINLKQQIENEISSFSEKVIFVDYLEPYSKVTFDFYNYCQTGYNKAFELIKRFDQSEKEPLSIVSQLLVKFNSNTPNKTSNWLGVLSEIAESKATANIELIRSLKQIKSNEEKIKEFKRILLDEVFEKYSSSILILSEELSNLSKFTNDNSNTIKDFEQFFNNFKSELQTKLKMLGLDLNYVPLFEHYEKYAAFTKLANQECSLPYKNVKDISKDSVLEIINYGFGNEETSVILA